MSDTVEHKTYKQALLEFYQAKGIPSSEIKFEAHPGMVYTYAKHGHVTIGISTHRARHRGEMHMDVLGPQSILARSGGPCAGGHRSKRCSVCGAANSLSQPYVMGCMLHDAQSGCWSA